jgi:hypothetical protein
MAATYTHATIKELFSVWSVLGLQGSRVEWSEFELSTVK